MEAGLTVMVDVLPIRSEGGGENDPHRVRLVVLSGPDFKSPHANLGAVCPSKRAAEHLADGVSWTLEQYPPALVDGRVELPDLPDEMEEPRG